MQGTFTLSGTQDDRTIVNRFSSLSEAVEAAYSSVARRGMRPDRIVDDQGEVVLTRDQLLDAMWQFWGETEY
jgi:hypothetical protein